MSTPAESREPTTEPGTTRADDQWHAVDALLVRVGQGNLRALGQLYDSTAAMILGLTNALLCDAGRAEQVTEEVFLEIWCWAGSFDPSRHSAMSWMVTLTHSRVIARR